MRHALRPSSIATLLLLAGPLLLGAGGSRVEEETAEPQPTPEQQANERYNQGLQHRDSAWRLEKKLARDDLPEAKRGKIEKNIRRAYESAVREFTAAVGLDPDHHQALGSLGYAHRQLGEYDKALQAYDAALALDPDYAQAIEYRGEAYLGLNRINDAQNAYRILLDKDPELAAELLGAMQRWIEQRRSEPRGVEVARLDGFARWVEDRGDAAAGSSLHKGRSW